MNKLQGTLLYVQIQTPVQPYQAAGEEKRPLEFKASLAITDKAVIKAFKKYCQEIDAKISLKEVDTTEFEEKYKIAPPEDAGDEIWVLTFRKSTELGKTGKPVPDLYKPKVFEKVGNKIIDVTNSKLPANGSKGFISTEVFTRKNGTSSIYLKNVLVTEMIEYKKPEADYEAGSEFDEFGDVASEPVAPTKAAKSAAKKQPVFDEDDSDMIPF
jgi:hypothetical protein